MPDPTPEHIELHRQTYSALEAILAEIQALAKRVESLHGEVRPVLDAYHLSLRTMQEAEAREAAEAVARVRAGGAAERAAAEEAAASAEAERKRLDAERKRLEAERRAAMARAGKYAAVILSLVLAAAAGRYLPDLAAGEVAVSP